MTEEEILMQRRIIQAAGFLAMIWGVMIGAVCGYLLCLMEHGR